MASGTIAGASRWTRAAAAAAGFFLPLRLGPARAALFTLFVRYRTDWPGHLCSRIAVFSPSRVFTPEEIYIMHKAFEAVCKSLRLRSGERAVENVAVMIVDFAATGILDVKGLVSATVAACRESGELLPARS
jgi:hypothetical protein